MESFHRVSKPTPIIKIRHIGAPQMQLFEQWISASYLVALTELILVLTPTKTKRKGGIRDKEKTTRQVSSCYSQGWSRHSRSTKYRICVKHFVSGKPTSDIYDKTSPSWLPTLHLGHKAVKWGCYKSSCWVIWKSTRKRPKVNCEPANATCSGG